ncbi:MAG TPA: CDP-alcohol phosphatidyltransferase family protein [Stellaceae bacterium]|jgi:CDP-diacylglycerol--glycerol-3-phosphate 3-phosphatidyltransferase/archaetidylinositol phosphate synthase|nr:CDP-alcohol phosphatidyltransferase family protein [Stellaceae bacterium]
MLDGYRKSTIDRFWNSLARPLARAGLSPNQVTGIGLVLVLGNCAAYLLHRNDFVFGVGLSVSFAFDALDGAVARLQGTASKFGGYLDAVIDRYQEIAVYFVIAWVNGWWIACFLATSGSLLISYNKARTAVEIPIANADWPDLLERLERIIILCAALLFDAVIPIPDFLGGDLLHAALIALALLTYVTGFQRFLRARRLILRAEGGDRG